MPHSVLRSGHVSMGDYALRRIGVETSFRRLSLCLGIREEKIRVLPTHSYIEHAAFAYEPASAVYSKPPRYRYSPSYIRRPSNTLCHRIITQEQCPVDACFLFKESDCNLAIPTLFGHSCGTCKPSLLPNTAMFPVIVPREGLLNYTV